MIIKFIKMKNLSNQKYNLPIFLVIYICYLISDHSSTHLRSNTAVSTRLAAKNDLYPSTNENCDALCLECSVNDLQSCITCKPGVFELNNKCYNNCPENTYADEEWQICLKCDPTCPICWGPSSEMCGNRKGVKTSAVLLENEIKLFFAKKKEESRNQISQRFRYFEFENVLIGKPFDLYEKASDSPSLENDLNNDRIDSETNKEIVDNINFNTSWLNTINVILKDVDIGNLYPQSHKNLIKYNNNIPNGVDSATISMEDVYGSKKIMSDLPVGSFSRKNGVFIPIPSYLDENMEIVDSHWIFVHGAWLGNKWINDWVPVLPSYIKQKGEKNKMYFENGGYWIYDNIKGETSNKFFLYQILIFN